MKMINQEPASFPSLGEAKQTKSLIISIIVIVLIVGGIFYYQKNKRVVAPAENENPNTSTLEENLIPTPEPEAEELLQKKVNEANAQELKAQASVKKAQWNNAMNNARTAFGRGEYDKALVFYNEALSYEKTDTVYSGLFVVFSAQNNIDQARVAIDAAIKLNPLFTQYWKDKLSLLNDKTNVSYQDLKNVYSEGLLKVDPKTKIDLVTYFAGVAERNGQKVDAISLWEYAKNLYPQNSIIYQGEIDRLQNM
ncbi:hypothetical protein A3A92_02255 [Candidatus Nomurabacteria bacterium RIFCSPLOWO2_01_FULL_37_49]|nr:MAG: hypothetical protein A3A92_02255 [Candidatus Nomurabacteria bacterium RIFCSPLOWO2_01_FULL_37_49]